MTHDKEGADGAHDPSDETLVSVTEGKPMADSRVIAKKLGKQHNDILRDIDRLVTATKLLSSDDWGQSFVEKRIPHPTIKEGVVRYFELDYSAFSLFVSEYGGNAPLLMILEYFSTFQNTTAPLTISQNLRSIH
jgi:phage regulator Rha-like protein